MFAIVQDQQDLPRLEVTAERLHRRRARSLLDAHRVRDRRRHERRVAHRAELGDPHTIAVGIEHFRRGLKRDARLADAAGADDGQEPPACEESFDLHQLAFAADDEGQRYR